MYIKCNFIHENINKHFISVKFLWQSLIHFKTLEQAKIDCLTRLPAGCGCGSGVCRGAKLCFINNVAKIKTHFTPSNMGQYMN